MAEFEPITTQEEFDSRIQSRLAREKAKYADYDTIKTELETLKTEKGTYSQSIESLKTEKADLQKQLEEAQGKVKAYEVNERRQKAAINANLDISMASRLKGETEEELKADAEELAKLLNTKKAPPLRKTEDGAKGSERQEALKELLHNLNIKGD